MGPRALRMFVRVFAFMYGGAIAVILAYGIGIFKKGPLLDIPDAQAGPHAIALKLAPSELRAAIDRAGADPNPEDSKRFIIEALFAAVVGDEQRHQEMRACIDRAETEPNTREGIRSLAACVDLIARPP
jgi:hypothetical protein